VQALNCNPAENSAVLSQCLHTNNGCITLLSGHNYTINNNAWSHTIQTSLEISSTELNIPAILVLQDISEEGLFTEGSIILNNLDIRGEGRGKFLNQEQIDLQVSGSLLFRIVLLKEITLTLLHQRLQSICFFISVVSVDVLTIMSVRLIQQTSLNFF